MTLLHKKQDRIANAVVCCKEALQARRKVIPDTRDNPDSFHLFVTVSRLHATVTYVLLIEISDKTKALFKWTAGGAHHRLSLQHLVPFLSS